MTRDILCYSLCGDRSSAIYLLLLEESNELMSETLCTQICKAVKESVNTDFPSKKNIEISHLSCIRLGPSVNGSASCRERKRAQEEVR